MTYEELVRAVGPGFHPDTDVSQYNKLPVGVSARDFEKIVLNAHLQGNAYERAWAVFLAEDWIKEA